LKGANVGGGHGGEKEETREHVPRHPKTRGVWQKSQGRGERKDKIHRRRKNVKKVRGKRGVVSSLLGETNY